MKVVVMLANECVAQRGEYEDTGREVGVLIDGEIIAGGKRVGVQSGEERVVCVLGVFLVGDGGG